MKCIKLLLTSLSVGFLTVSVAHANLANKYDILPNNIPTPIEFTIVKNGDNSADIFFPKTAVPAHLYCYFAPPNNQQYQGIVAHFTSKNTRITFQPGMDQTLAGGRHDVKIFTVEQVAGNDNMGNVTITLDGDINIPSATIMCAMQKIK